MPTVPTEVQFAGVTVYLTAPSQQRVQQEIARLYSDPTGLRNAIEQMRNIDSVLEPLLEEHNAPSDFRYACLPFQPNGGYWGLDATRASLLHLRVDNVVDERLNLSSASDATLAELTALLTKRTNWARTLIAFLQGQRSTMAADVPANTPTATKGTLQLGLDSPDAIWTVLARKLVFEREAPLIRPTDQFLLYDYRQGRGKSLASIAAELGIEQNRFVPFNEWLKVRLIPTDKTYPVLIRLTPNEYISVRSQVNATVQTQQSPTQQPVRRDMGFPVLRRLPVSTSNDPLTRASAIFYEINGHKGIQAQSCDNIITLSYYGDMDLKRFMQFNDLTERDLIRPGELYYLEMKDRKAKVPFHVVQPGQTLRDVSNMYGVRLKSLLTFNRMEATQRVQPGRILWMQERRPKDQPVEYQKMPDVLPDPEPALAQRKLTREDEESAVDSPAPPNWTLSNPDSSQRAVSMRMGAATPRSTTPPADGGNANKGFAFYTVKKGDTHSSVAQQFNLKLIDLMSWNNLSYRKPLVPGTQLIVSRPVTVADDEPAPMTAPPTPTKPAANPTATQPTVADNVAPSRPATGVPSTTNPTSNPRPATSPSTRPAPPTTKQREYSESIIDVDSKWSVPPPRSVIRAQSKGVINNFRVETPKVNGKQFYHVVQPGQTVYRVALINKVSIPDLMRWNNLTNYNIEVGQRLLIRK